MICSICEIPIYYEEHGTGKPILCIHGYSLDHRAMAGCMEPVFNKISDSNYRRIYLDLPGMGKTPAAWIKNSEDMLKVLIGFIDAVIPNDNFLLAGQSFGGHLALGLICKMANRIDGVTLIAPLVTHECYSDGKLPERQILYKSEDLGSPEENPDIKSFMEMAVIATPEICERYKNEILSGISIADNDFLYSGRFKGQVSEFEDMLKSVKFDKPACIITGRQDHEVGYAHAYELLDKFPRATFAALDCAGHNLQIENEPLFSQLITDWLWRVGL